MKHIIVKEKSTFERFKPLRDRVKGIKVYRSEQPPMCNGSKRGIWEGKDYRHPPVRMRHSGYAQSGTGVWITRWVCGVCGVKTTTGRTGTVLTSKPPRRH